MVSLTSNISALQIQDELRTATNQINQALERLSTGYKVNSAKDDAAGYSIATEMETKIGAYDVAEVNAMIGMDFLNTATSSLELISSHLDRVKSLAVQAQNGGYDFVSLNAINNEAKQRVNEIKRKIRITRFLLFIV